MDENLQYYSRNNTPILIYNVDAGGDYPIHGAYAAGDAWIPIVWTRAGEMKEGEVRPLDIDFDRTVFE